MCIGLVYAFASLVLCVLPCSFGLILQVRQYRISNQEEMDIQLQLSIAGWYAIVLQGVARCGKVLQGVAKVLTWKMDE